MGEAARREQTAIATGGASSPSPTASHVSTSQHIASPSPHMTAAVDPAWNFDANAWAHDMFKRTERTSAATQKCHALHGPTTVYSATAESEVRPNEVTERLQETLPVDTNTLGDSDKENKEPNEADGTLPQRRSIQRDFWFGSRP